MSDNVFESLGIDTECPGDDFGEFVDACGEAKKILEKYGKMPKDLKPVCDNCANSPYLPRSVFQKRLARKFNFAPEDVEELCKLCEQLDICIIKADLV